MNPIKIVHIVCRMEFGGVESVILNYMKQLDKSRFEFHIITQDINDEKCIKSFIDEGFTVHIITHKRKNIVRNVIQLFKVLRKNRFKIIHSHMTLTNFYVLLLAMFLGSKVRISHSHNDMHADSKIKSFLYKVLSIVNCTVATHYFACGVDAASFLFGSKNMYTGKVHILNNAIDTEKYSYNVKIRESIRKQLEVEEKVCVGHVGRFMEQKNQLFLLEIFADYHKENPNSVLLLIGDGELKDKLIKKSRELEISGSVIFTGNVSNVNEYYHAMDIFLLPSHFEGLPVVLVEAQCSGLPCLVSDKVDKRCNFGNEVKFISIDNTNNWVREMKKITALRREDGTNKLRNNHYSIKDEAKWLENFYIDTVRG